MNVERAIAGRLVRLECASRLAPAAQDVLDILERRARAGARLAPGWRMRLGWSLVVLKEDPDGALRACEPAFEGAASRDTAPTLDWTLEVIVAQVGVARRVGVAPVDFAFDDEMLVRPRALSAARLAMLRCTWPDGRSGWFAAGTDELDAELAHVELQTVPVHRLVQMWPLALSVMVLPMGYSVELGRHRIVHVFDDAGRECWQTRGETAA